MGDVAIRVEGLGKQFRIGGRKAKYRTLRDTLTEAFASPLRRIRNRLRGSEAGTGEPDDTIWALRGISLEVKQGELVGVIGANGAGKSTLLKVLSRIVVPTEGSAEIHGRVGSLLEVGTGFHQELTGRENMFLNGAILGMTRAEITRKFDEIVAFADIERFLDTPVKHYSSGMYLRLAFAVAAHLDPEILLLDEVLAVGDRAFQKKCMSKMKEVAKERRTILFVSHNMSSVAQLCARTILIDQGRVVRDGPSHEVISQYLHAEGGPAAVRGWADQSTAPGGEIARLRAVRVLAANGQVTNVVDIREPVGIEMEYEVLKGGHIISQWYNVSNEEDLMLFSTIDCDPAWLRRPRPAGRYLSTAWVPGNFLAEGKVFVGAGLATVDPYIYEFDERNVVAFEVVEGGDGDSVRGDWNGHWPGVVRPMLKWRTELRPSV